MTKSRFIDIHGEPIEWQALETPQTENEARVAMLRQHYSSHPSSGLTPAKLASILRQSEEGDLIAQCELAEDIEEKDGHIQSELSKRRRAVLGYNWRIVPPTDASTAEAEDAKLIESVLRQATWLEDTLFDLSDAILKGFSALELEWESVDRVKMPVAAHWRDPAWFQTHPDNRNELRLRDGSYEGLKLQPFGWISHCARAKSGYLARQGLIRVLAWPFIFKNYSVRDLAEFLEIYGLPIRLGKYPSGATKTEKATLLRAVMSIGHNAGGIIPQGMDIDFEKAVNTANADTFMAMVDWCERTQSKAILGGTLTSQADGKTSTNALGNVHNECRKELSESDARQLARTLTRDLVYPLYLLNGRGEVKPTRLPRFEFDFTEAADISALSTSLPGLVDAGVRIPLHWANEQLQIPQPQDNEPVLARPATTTGFDSALLKGVLNNDLTALKGQTDPVQDQLDNALQSVPAEQNQQLMELLLQPLVQSLQTQGPEQAMEQLAGLYPQMDDTQLVEMLQRLMFVADTWGRLNEQR